MTSEEALHIANLFKKNDHYLMAQSYKFQDPIILDFGPTFRADAQTAGDCSRVKCTEHGHLIDDSTASCGRSKGSGEPAPFNIRCRCRANELRVAARQGTCLAKMVRWHTPVEALQVATADDGEFALRAILPRQAWCPNHRGIRA
jgi:hypothetical protein